MATDLTALLGGGGGGIKSVQRGSGYMSGSENSTSIAITAVNMNKSFLIFSNTTGDDTNQRAFVLGRIDTASTLFFFRASYLNDLGIGWEVIEFE